MYEAYDSAPRKTMNEKRKKTGQWVERVWKPAIFVVLIAGVVYGMKLSPVVVTSHTVERGPIVSEVMGTGTLEARISVTVSPKISGRMIEILVDQGDRVKEGDVMVRLEDTDLRQQVAIAESELETARSAIGRLLADKDRADAVAAQAQRDNRQTQSLFAGDAATQDEADRAAETLSVAKAELARAVAALAEGRSSVVSSENTLKYQQARLDDATIRAPFDGLIVRRHREAGDIVVPGSAILSLVSTDELWIEAWVDETQMSALRVGQPARVIFRSEPEHPYPGEVARLGREADRETREFIVNVRALQLPENWAVGQRAEVYIESGSKDSATLVSPELLQVRDDQQGVFVDVNGKARWRPVTVGLRNAQRVEIIEGVSEGDIVVKPTKAARVLRDGQRVSSP
jgi:HlyD family secretion protein